MTFCPHTLTSYISQVGHLRIVSSQLIHLCFRLLLVGLHIKLRNGDIHFIIAVWSFDSTAVRPRKMQLTWYRWTHRLIYRVWIRNARFVQNQQKQGRRGHQIAMFGSPQSRYRHGNHFDIIDENSAARTVTWKKNFSPSACTMCILAWFRSDTQRCQIQVHKVKKKKKRLPAGWVEVPVAKDKLWHGFYIPYLDFSSLLIPA